MLRTGHLRPAFLGLALGTLSATALAAPMTYQIDPAHTYPSFEADHNGGLSNWRGKFNSSSGSITLDQEAQTGSIDVIVDMSSIDFGHDALNEHARSPDIFNVAEFPTATYSGTLAGFTDGAPTRVEGELTMNGVTQPLNLEIRQFMCKPVRGRDMCGADAYAEFDRSDFGVDFGAQMGLDMKVVLRIQVEAAASE
jgi:polyisoprenoid-binding protein YceI